MLMYLVDLLIVNVNIIVFRRVYTVVGSLLMLCLGI